MVRLSALTLLIARHVAAVPLDAEFEVLVGIETLCIHAELRHVALLGLDLASHLLDLDDDELGRFERGKADQDVDHAAVDVILGGGF